MWSKGGYSEYDFMRMKQDAIERARQAHQRASNNGASASYGSWQRRDESVPPPPPQGETRCPRCGRMLRNGQHVYEARTRSAPARPEPQPSPPPKPPPPPPKHTPPEQGLPKKLTLPLLGEIELDRDFILIGGLLLVLLSEEGDRLLMLALVYIML